MIKPLPQWITPGNRYAFDDFESATAQEMVGRIYKKMQELVNDYSSIIETTDSSIEEFKETSTEAYKEFMDEVNKIVHDYIYMLDMKVVNQDRKIDEATGFMKENLSGYVESTIDGMKTDGSLDATILDVFNGIGQRVDTLENTEYTLEVDDNENLMLVKRVGGDQ